MKTASKQLLLTEDQIHAAVAILRGTPWTPNHPSWCYNGLPRIEYHIYKVFKEYPARMVAMFCDLSDSRYHASEFLRARRANKARWHSTSNVFVCYATIRESEEAFRPTAGGEWWIDAETGNEPEFIASARAKYAARKAVLA